MIKEWVPEEKPESRELKERLDMAHEKLKRQQVKIKEHRLPVIVLIEGWGTAGKGSTISSIIRSVDPRFFKVASMSVVSEEERLRPFLYRYFTQIPEAGKFLFLENGWADEVCRLRAQEKLNKEEYTERVESIKRFERQLTDNGYLVLKFFFHISHKEQKKRLKELMDHKDTGFRVEEQDLWQNKHYDKYVDVYDKYLKCTNVAGAPWYIVDAEDKKWTQLQVLEVLCSGMEIALQNRNRAMPFLQNIFPLMKMPKLSEIALDKTIEDHVYKAQLKDLQHQLNTLHYRLYRKKIPVIIVYEGWDAAGKGGNIKRITGALDPRGFEVHPIACPEPHEKSRHYLWRFWTKLPKTGHIAIFDRSWYGRVMVERLEEFCSTNDWKRAYNEINEFEKELAYWGAVIIKFWVQIDKDTQLERFTERQNTLEKQWKITDEDWRNREKWDAYEEAANEMLQKTNTTYAPWHVLASVDKKYARIQALKIVIETLEAALR